MSDVKIKQAVVDCGCHTNQWYIAREANNWDGLKVTEYLHSDGVWRKSAYNDQIPSGWYRTETHAKNALTSLLTPSNKDWSSVLVNTREKVIWDALYKAVCQKIIPDTNLSELSQLVEDAIEAWENTDEVQLQQAVSNGQLD